MSATNGASSEGAEDHVRIFDTTLRDGEQSPGATLTSDEKLEIARALSRLGVDVIEAGFPAASPDDYAAVRMVAEKVGNDAVAGRPDARPPIICGLARSTRGDIDRAWDAVRVAARPRIHTFLSTSPIHREHKLRMTTDQVIAKIREMVAFARDLCEDVEFSPEDSTRTEPEFLWEAVATAIAAGATTINLPDTVGYTTPRDMFAMIEGVKKNVPGIEKVVISVHCHDDLGLGAANTLAGIEAGARQAEVTINGIGERAGNTALEEVVMALRTRRDRFHVRTGIDTTQITRISRLVSAHTGMLVPPNKAIVGANAFAHESGIHQDGMLKNGLTYEIMRAEDVGASGTKLVLGKHSGRHALKERLAELGVALDSNAALDAAFQSMKALAERKKHVTDADLLALVSSDRNEEEAALKLDGLVVSSGTLGMPTASVRLRKADGTMVTQAAIGTGPVDATFRAIDQLAGAKSTLIEYLVHAVTEGIDALGEVSVRVRDEHGELYQGYAADTDVIVASAKAYLVAINRLRREQGAAAARIKSTDAARSMHPDATPTSAASGAMPVQAK